MFPAMLDFKQLPLLLGGTGPAVERRFVLLQEAGAVDLRVRIAHPSPALAAEAGDRLIARLPVAGDLEGVRVLFLAGLPRADATALVEHARQMGILVNTEDDLPLCDFHVPSMLRRGDLLIAVGTGGNSPGLARRLRRYLETMLPPIWSDRLFELSGLRRGWRALGLDNETVASMTDEHIQRQGWLP